MPPALLHAVKALTVALSEEQAARRDAEPTAAELLARLHKATCLVATLKVLTASDEMAAMATSAMAMSAAAEYDKLMAQRATVRHLKKERDKLKELHASAVAAVPEVHVLEQAFTFQEPPADVAAVVAMDKTIETAIATYEGLFLQLKALERALIEDVTECKKQEQRLATREAAAEELRLQAAASKACLKAHVAEHAAAKEACKQDASLGRYQQLLSTELAAATLGGSSVFNRRAAAATLGFKATLDSARPIPTSVDDLENCICPALARCVSLLRARSAVRADSPGTHGCALCSRASLQKAAEAASPAPQDEQQSALEQLALALPGAPARRRAHHALRAAAAASCRIFHALHDATVASRR